MHRLKSTQVKQHRDELLLAQGGRCLLCQERIEGDDVPVLDHDHNTGHVRGVLHRGCNAMLGHIENNRARNYLKGGRLFRMLRGIEAYILRDYASLGTPLHHTFKTEDEKRERRNKLARARRAKEKV